MSLDTGTNESSDLAILGLNCMVRWGRGDWLPAVRIGETFTDHKGLRLAKPDEFKDMSPEQIASEMKVGNRFYVGHLMPSVSSSKMHASQK